jgi:hypothetical protein
MNKLHLIVRMIFAALTLFCAAVTLTGRIDYILITAMAATAWWASEKSRAERSKK